MQMQLPVLWRYQLETDRETLKMSKLITTPNLTDPDGFYAELLALHEGLDKDKSDAINARLILLLANHIGDRDVLRQAFSTAKAG